MIPENEHARAHREHVGRLAERLGPILGSIDLEHLVSLQKHDHDVPVEVELARVRELLIVSASYDAQHLLTPTPEGNWVRQPLDNYPDHVRYENGTIFQYNIPIEPIMRSVLDERRVFDLCVGGAR